MQTMSAITKRESGNSNEEESELRRGPWTLEEDSLLIHYIARHGEGRWNMLAKSAGLKRTGKSCRLRWLNYLKPDIKRGNLSPQEQLLILELHSKWGNRWSKIAQHLPGRTDNEIKNYWRTRVQKQARQLNVESDSKKFVEAIRCFWIPRLLQRMEQNSSPFASYSSLTKTNIGNSEAITSMPNAPLVNNQSLSPSPPPQREFIDAANYSNSMSSLSNIPSSLDSLQFSHMPEISKCQTSPYPNVFESNVSSSNPIQESWYVNTNNGYGMEGLNQELPQPVMENYDISQFDFEIAESDWVLGNMGDTLWNMDAM